TPAPRLLAVRGVLPFCRFARVEPLPRPWGAAQRVQSGLTGARGSGRRSAGGGEPGGGQVVGGGARAGEHLGEAAATGQRELVAQARGVALEVDTSPDLQVLQDAVRGRHGGVVE